MNSEQQIFLRDKALDYFLRYVQINTQSDPDSLSFPSSSCQLELGKIIVQDLHKLGVTNAELDDFGYVYAVLQASPDCRSGQLSFIAHMDTSPSEPGGSVLPVIHRSYQGGSISFTDDPDLKLTPSDSPELLKFIGEDVITASGKTLLGADDKAGIAAIMAAVELLVTYPELQHPELRLVFTPDEEVGQGTDHIDLQRLAPVAYTIDGGELGELEAECFDAWSLSVTLTGRNVHPGSAKNIMVNAAAIAARFFAALPEWETPEHTEKREGFYHLTAIKGDEVKAELHFIIRDFEEANNLKRLEVIGKLKEFFLAKYPGLGIELESRHSYQNMRLVLDKYPQVVEKAAQAMRDCGIDVLPGAVRGGTDGARLCFMGIPTPNIFSGGVMFHSELEWIPVVALQKAAEVVVRLAELYCS